MKRIILICLSLVLTVTLLLAGVNGLTTRSSASSIQSVIQTKLDELGVTDAQDMGIVEDEMDICVGCRLYTSASTGLKLYFYPDNGELRMIRQMPTMEDFRSEEAAAVQQVYTPVGADTSSDESLYLTEEERLAIAADYARIAIGEHLFGELRYSGSAGTIYEFCEYYNDQVTGTRVGIRLDDEGNLAFCSPKISTLYVKNEDGTYSLKNGTDFIPEQQAMDLAWDVMQGEMKNFMSSAREEDATCVRGLNENSIYYVVTCPFLDTCEEPCTRNFYAYVDAYTGELIKFDFTK